MNEKDIKPFYLLGNPIRVAEFATIDKIGPQENIFLTAIKEWKNGDAVFYQSLDKVRVEAVMDFSGKSVGAKACPGFVAHPRRREVQVSTTSLP